MTTTSTEPAATGVSEATAALDKARALARAIGECEAFRAFEAAQEALEGDRELSARLAAVQVREQELRASRAWGGADPAEEKALEREWEELASQPALLAHLTARDNLLALLREVVGEIGEGIGVDYGAACAPAGGCC
jgi:cell fate (sporulation/competence/biofilm development) regulator YlbF (YheA/YmcA/DUF963 family)